MRWPTWKSWAPFRRLTRHHSGKQPTRRPFRRQLHIEVLENRAVPAALMAPSLTGVAFIDSHFNGTYASGETLLPGVSVSLSGTSYLDKTVSATTTTDQSGHYEFQNVPNGTYQITFGAASGYLSGGAPGGSLSGAEGATVVSGYTVSNGQTSPQNVSFLGLAPESISLRLFLSSTTASDFSFSPAGAGTTGATGPTLKKAISAQTLSSTTPQYIDLAGYFTAPDIINGTKVALGITYSTLSGSTFTSHTATVNVVLDDADTPQTVDNFLDYCLNKDSTSYLDTVFHRSVTSPEVLQGGGYLPPSADGATTLTDIVTSSDPTVPGEVNLPNSTGTIAMANTGTEDSGTSQFYFNMANNTDLDSQKVYTVFGKVASNADLQILQTLFAIPTTDINSTFTTIPLVGYSQYTAAGGTGFPSATKYYLQITSVAVTNRNEDLTYTVSSSNTSVVAATIPTDYPEQLLLTPGKAGTATITVTAKDQYGNTTDTTFQVTVPATATSFAVSTPTSATASTSFAFTVTAKDQFGNTDPNYTGTVKFTSTDSGTGVSLPSSYTFTAADAGVHTFDATLVTAGSQTITAADTTQTSITGTSNSITVS